MVGAFDFRENTMTASRGFSIIELLIALAIAGIMFAVALPAYNGYVLRSHRADAHASLLDISARLEKYMSQRNRYTTEITAADGLNLPNNLSREEFYSMEVRACGTGNISICYEVRATALGSQTADTDCLLITYDSTGVKGGTTEECW